MAAGHIWTRPELVEIVERHVEKASRRFDRWLTTELREALRSRVRDTLFTNPTAASLVHAVAFPPAPAVPRAARLADAEKEKKRLAHRFS